MRTTALTLMLTLMVAVVGFAQKVTKSDPEAARTQDVLKQARAALGSEAKLKTVKSLSVSGKFRRVVGGRDVSGDLEFDLLLPDKYLKTEIMNPVPSVSITSIDIVNGQNVVLDAHTSGPGHIVYNRPGTGSPEAKASAQRAAREEFARLLVSWLLTAPSTFPIDFKYVGQADAADGRADVLGLNGPNDFSARLFLDQKTHLPLMLDYKGPAPRGAFQTSRGNESNDEIQKKIQEQLAKNPTGEVEIQVRFSDYRSVDGILFPHSITKSINGQPNEEWQMAKYKLNPPLNPDKFGKD